MTKAESAMIRAQLAMIDRQSVIAPSAGAEQLRKQRRSMLEQLIGIAQKALEAEEQRYKLGVAGTDAVNRRRSELLDLEIELAHLDKK
jgi:outer membrane protein TolC